MEREAHATCLDLRTLSKSILFVAWWAPREREGRWPFTKMGKRGWGVGGSNLGGGVQVSHPSQAKTTQQRTHARCALCYSQALPCYWTLCFYRTLSFFFVFNPAGSFLWPSCVSHLIHMFNTANQSMSLSGDFQNPSIFQNTKLIRFRAK